MGLVTDRDVVLPPDLSSLPVVVLDAAELDHLELVADGIAGAAGYPGHEADVPLPAGLSLPAATAAAVAPGGRLLLEDAEAVPLAVLTVDTVRRRDDGSADASGSVTLLRPATHGPFRRLRRTPGEVREALADLVPAVLVTERPLFPDEPTVRAAVQNGRPVVVLALVGSGRRPWPSAPGLVRGLRAALPALPDRSLLVTVPLPAYRGADRDHRAREAVALAYGADRLLEPPAMAEHELDAALDALEQDDRPVPAAVARALRGARLPLHHRGLVVLFTGLSGSGKSTVAKGVHEALLESSDRTVTLLDGDVVRRHLSKGLGFSRADRDLNVRRIGFVAAEVARHGGLALCAPIAPYAETRAALRGMAEEAGGTFVLIHVSTPIEVCEARDRKGLYARARAGLIESFTGVSDPYEEPDDADLTLNTAEQSVEEAVDRVLDLLRLRGLVPGARRMEG